MYLFLKRSSSENDKEWTDTKKKKKKKTRKFSEELMFIMWKVQQVYFD